jgi:DNA-binding NtrC family response regulator
MKTNRKIAVVDDYPMYNALITESIKNNVDYKSNLEVTSFNNAESLIESITKEDYCPDLVFTDYDLSGPFEGGFMNGEELLKYMNDKKPATKIVMVSAHKNKDLIKSTLNNNAYDFIVKDESAVSNILNKMEEVFTVIKKEKLARAQSNIKIGMYVFVTASLIMSYLFI